MKLNIFFNIFLINLLLIKSPFAQEISSTNSKTYEAKTIKKDNEIEIRLIPKNPPVIIPKNPPVKVEKDSDDEDSEDDEDSDESDDTDPDAQKVEGEKDQEMVYNKNSDGKNFSAQELAEIKAKNSNMARENSLKLWREEEKRLREERIKSRKEESRKKYQAQKERSVIKEIENLNQKLKNEQAIKNYQNLGGSNPSFTYQAQPLNSGTVPVTNSPSAPVVNSPATTPSNTPSPPVVNSPATPSSNTSTQPTR